MCIFRRRTFMPGAKSNCVGPGAEGKANHDPEPEYAPSPLSKETVAISKIYSLSVLVGIPDLAEAFRSQNSVHFLGGDCAGSSCDCNRPRRIRPPQSCLSASASLLALFQKHRACGSRKHLPSNPASGCTFPQLAHSPQTDVQRGSYDPPKSCCAHARSLRNMAAQALQ